MSHSPLRTAGIVAARSLGVLAAGLSATAAVRAARHVPARPFYSALHHQLELERVGRHGTGLLFRWPGSDPDLAAEPLILMADQDVVPSEGQAWDVEPFAGVVMDGRVVGRGAIDDKGALLTILEAVEALVARGFTPRRDVYLAFGDCEAAAVPPPSRWPACFASAGSTRGWCSTRAARSSTAGCCPGSPRPPR